MSAPIVVPFDGMPQNVVRGQRQTTGTSSYTVPSGYFARVKMHIHVGAAATFTGPQIANFGGATDLSCDTMVTDIVLLPGQQINFFTTIGASASYDNSFGPLAGTLAVSSLLGASITGDSFNFIQINKTNTLSFSVPSTPSSALTLVPTAILGWYIEEFPVRS